MGLRVQFTPDDLGFPETLETEVLGEEIEVEVDYQEACQTFCDKFLDIAHNLVPIRTGYLDYTIGAETDGWQVEAYAEAEYAQYVEYGTWKMQAKPYFTPAVEQAWQDFIELANGAIQQAQEELKDMANEIIQEHMEEEEGESLLGSTLLAILFFIILTPLLMIGYGVMDSFGLEGSVGIPEIEID